MVYQSLFLELYIGFGLHRHMWSHPLSQMNIKQILFTKKGVIIPIYHYQMNVPLCNRDYPYLCLDVIISQCRKLD